LQSSSPPRGGCLFFYLLACQVIAAAEERIAFIGSQLICAGGQGLLRPVLPVIALSHSRLCCWGEVSPLRRAMGPATPLSGGIPPQRPLFNFVALRRAVEYSPRAALLIFRKGGAAYAGR